MTNYGTTIDDAKRAARQQHPYYAVALDRLRLQEDRSVPTMATSKHWVTHYNPDTLREWTAAEAGAVLVHELEHLLRRHHERCGDRDAGNFNIAGDAEINQRLDGLPADAVYPESLGMPRGHSAEVYYAATAGKQQQPGSDGDGSGSDGAAGQPGQASCGSAAGGPDQAHERGDAQRPGMGAGMADATRQDAARRVLAQQPGRGTEAGDELRDWAESELNIDRAGWYRALAMAVGNSLSSTGAPTRWLWPGRRDPRDMGGAVLPRWTSDRPACAVVIDTSGSITPADIEMAVAAGHFLKRIADVEFYACDAVSRPLGKTLPDRLPGGGGTDMREGISMAIRDGARAVVVITDCDSPWPPEPTAVPVIVGANVNAQTRWVPDWMTVLPIIASSDDDVR